MAEAARELSVQDRLDIQDLFARYCWGLDTGDIEAVLACFTPDGYLQHPPQGKCVGPDGIRRLLEELWHGRGKNWFRGRQHTGCHFVMEPEDGGVRVKGFWQILQYSLDYKSTFVFAIGNWDNSCVKQDGKWLFRALRVTAWVSEDTIPWDGRTGIETSAPSARLTG